MGPAGAALPDEEARCRICFEGGEDEANALVAPCQCRGSQRLVHLRCLERCLVAELARARSESAPLQCSVCLSAFAYQLHTPPPPLVRRGSLLVAARSLTGSFERSVILMTETEQRHLGLVLTKPCGRFDGLHSIETPTACFRGGPVCGGRFGVTNYILLRCSTEPADEFSVELLRTPGHESLLMGPSWAPVDRAHLTREARAHALAPGANQVLCFRGYCAWGAQQLRNELARGMWGVVDCAEMSDILIAARERGAEAAEDALPGDESPPQCSLWDTFEAEAAERVVWPAKPAMVQILASSAAGLGGAPACDGDDGRPC